MALDGGEDWTLRDVLAGMVVPLPLQAIGQGSKDGLVLLRRIFASFSQAIVLIGVVVIVLYLTDSLGEASIDLVPAAAGLVLVSALLLTLARVIPQPLDCSDPSTLAGYYRTRFFIRIACSEAPALLGFVAFILTNQPLLYVLGAAATMIGFMHAAPTTRNIDLDQEELSSRGCGISLVQALRGPATGSSG